MTKQARITLNHLLFQLEQTPISFNGLNLSFTTGRYGIVGNNSIGKSTLLKLILGELQVDIG